MVSILDNSGSSGDRGRAANYAVFVTLLDIYGEFIGVYAFLGGFRTRFSSSTSRSTSVGVGASIAAAVAAARNGADTVLVERYGVLGGMATGGVVTILPNLSDMYGKQQIAGQTQEWIDRMNKRQATAYPPRELWGCKDKRQVKEWFERSFFYTRLDMVIYSVLFDAEILKCVLNDMVEEAGVKTILHAWGTRPIVDGNTVRGVIIESKSGRQAILGKVVIDSTGDGDLLLPSGAECDTRMLPKLRITNMAFPFWIGNIDMKKAEEFKTSQPEKYDELMQELMSLGVAARYLKDLVRYHEGVVWFHPFYPSKDQADVAELNRVELEGRKKMLITYDFYRKHVPGFENSYITLSSPQLGTQGGRRVIGEYVLTEKDMVSDEIFEDTIAIFADNDNGEISAKHPNICIPYRSLVPKKIEGLLVACRAFSSECGFNEYFNLIPHCIALGQAAGTAAALAVKAGIKPREVDYGALQEHLTHQGVILPDVIARTR